ncbi:MAG: ExbD/TolR family protein [Candidatus Competibacterales bacterium]
MELRGRRRRGDELTVNLTPLIDVVFLLLIFFMISTTFVQEADLAVTLPEVERESAPRDSRTIELIIDREGTVAVAGQTLVERDTPALRAALTALAGDERDLPFVIRADERAPQGAVVWAMDVAGNMGFRRVNIAAVGQP